MNVDIHMNSYSWIARLSANYFKKKHLATAVALPLAGDISPILGGIGYMGIEIDFIVS